MTNPNPWPSIVERFLRYVQIDTQSDPESTTVPSTEKQKDLGRLLLEELLDLGIEDATMDEYGYVMGTLPSNLPSETANELPVIALVAHMDTSFDESGTNVQPMIHPNYQGQVLALPGNPSVQLDPIKDPVLKEHIGHDIITSDGTTLLGSDDKAGVAIIMQCVQDLLADPFMPHPNIRVCFTIDEEIGRGVDHLDLTQLGADLAYTLDGDGTGTLSVETFNAAEAIVSVEGVMVHPGYAKGIMVNALRILAELIVALPSNEAPETTEGQDGYFHVHHMGTGEVQKARIKILLRDFTWDGLTRRKVYLTEQIEQLRLRYPGASIHLTIKDQYRNMRTYIEEQDPRTITFAQQAAKQARIPLRLTSVRGGTDGSRLSEKGLPTPNLFTGGHQFHSCFEWNTVQNLEQSLTFLKTLIQYWAEQGTPQ